METFKVGDFVKLTGPDWKDTNLSPDKPYRVLSVPEEDDKWAVVQDGWMVDPSPGQPFSGEVIPEWKWDLLHPDKPHARETDFGVSVQEVVNEVRDTLIAKNKAYGNSALEPVRVFSTSDPVEQLRVRIDDKLSRLKSSLNDDNEDTVLDLMGYLVLLRIATRKQDSE